MVYPLSLTKVDQVIMTGTLANSRRWAGVMHGLSTVTGGTSTNLLAMVANRWDILLKGVVSDQVILKEIKCRQVKQWKPRYGRVPVVAIAMGGGVITGVTVIDGGQGFDGEPEFDLLDPTGIGAMLDVTMSGDQVALVDVVAGGTGYSDPIIDWALPTGVTPPGKVQRTQIIYGPRDRLKTAPLPLTGTVTTDALPNFNAYSVQINGPEGGRDGRGTLHHPGVPESKTTLNKIATAEYAALNSAFQDFFATATVGTGTWKFGVFSPTEFAAGTQAVPSLSDDFIQLVVSTDITLSTLVGVMRRRKVTVA